MPNMPARLTNPLGIILVVMLLLVIRVQAALRWRTLSALSALSALMPCPASPNRCACSNAQSSADPANRAPNSALAKGVGWGSLKRGLMFQAAYGWKMGCVGLMFQAAFWSGLMFV